MATLETIKVTLDTAEANEAIDALTAKVEHLIERIQVASQMLGCSTQQVLTRSVQVELKGSDLLGAIQIETDRLGRVRGK